MMSPDMFMKYAKEYIINNYYRTPNGKAQTIRTNAVQLLTYTTFGMSYRAFFYAPTQCDAKIYECMYEGTDDSFVCNSFLRLNHRIEEEVSNKYRLLKAEEDRLYNMED